MTAQRTSRWLAALVLVLAAGCGGGGGSSGSNAAPEPATDGDSDSSAAGASGGAVAGGGGWSSGVFEPSARFEAQCAEPRTGVDPETGAPWPDRPGTRLDENNWLRSWTHELYLWFDEVIDRNPANYRTPEYFDLLRTFQTTASGQPRDQFHFSLPTETWQQRSQSGVVVGFGVQWAWRQRTPPRNIAVRLVEADSPAAEPGGLARGMRLLAIDGVDVVGATAAEDEALIERVLREPVEGSSHTLTLRDLDGNEHRATLTARAIETQPVPVVSTLPAAGGRVGYILFNDHNAVAEQALVDGVSALADAGVSELVLDLRYNGGGLLALASQLAYMVAGPGPTAGRAFERTEFNDKHPQINPVTGETIAPVPFHDTTLGFSARPAGQPLPWLDLERVFVLTGPETCSASESIVNGLRGVGVEVVQVGERTCGKPYGTYPTDNCGTTYFTTMFRGVNDQGFGGYQNGFVPEQAAAEFGVSVPGCSVVDDLGQELGSAEEARLAAALGWIENEGTCPRAASTATAQRPPDASRPRVSQGLRVMTR